MTFLAMRITAGKLLIGSISVYALVSLCARWFRDSAAGTSAVPFGEGDGSTSVLCCAVLCFVVLWEVESDRTPEGFRPDSGGIPTGTTRSDSASSQVRARLALALRSLSLRLCRPMSSALRFHFNHERTTYPPVTWLQSSTWHSSAARRATLRSRMPTTATSWRSLMKPSETDSAQKARPRT